jgi:hypothetical protein
MADEQPDTHPHNHQQDSPAEPAPADKTGDKQSFPPDAKQYSLTHLESQLVTKVFRNQQANFAALLSHIAQSRLGYPVTDRTQMQLSNDAKTIFLFEKPSAPGEGQPPADAGGAVRTAE